MSIWQGRGGTRQVKSLTGQSVAGRRLVGQGRVGQAKT